jgi:hypothetical protein
LTPVARLANGAGMTRLDCERRCKGILVDALKRIASESIGPHDRDSVVEYLGRVW